MTVHHCRAVNSRTSSYDVSTQCIPALNQRNRKNRDGPPWLVLRNSRAMAGLNVSEFSAEKVNENTIVMANWLYIRPVSPGMNATGTNTAASTSVMVTIGVVISAIAAIAAGSGLKPRWRNFSTFSTTMIASSTTSPIARTSPQSVRLLIEKPNAAIAAKVATSETGMASIGISVARNPWRKMNTTIMTRMNASMSVWPTSSMFSWTYLVVS